MGNSGEEGGVVACRSACDAFGLDQYCCSGEFANPSTCRPSFYSSIFKRACPRAYSYAFDDGTSTFTCKAYEYAIIFCPNFHCNLVLFTFILQVLLALLDLKFQNEPNFVFQAYPKTIKAAVASLLVFALKVKVDFTFHSCHLSPTCSYLLSTNIMLCGSLLVASLASLLFPNTCRPLIYLIYLLLSLGN